ncbi:MAG: DUF362 domain-containing protein [Candidatus Falkowbacteria bacterium]|nr:DUF362 domain-containing protein [Candidatus Falkowbacteria bacterium]
MSKVYFVKIDEIEKIKNLLPEFIAPLGVKVHFGERGCETFVPAKLVNEITDLVADSTFIETSVLYKSPRQTAAGHEGVAQEHGFNFLPFDFLDGEVGDNCSEVQINSQSSYTQALEHKHFQKCYLGKNLEKYKSLLVISHFKGHLGVGFGGAIKNIGMGLACRRGKLAIHSSIKHQIKKEKCISCGECIAHCPVNAIAFDQDKKAFIDQNICISCSKCISVCPQGAVRIPWDSVGKIDLEERLAEYAFASQLNKQCFYINFLINITNDCDCLGKRMEKIIDDIGVLVSSDPVAIDQASYNLVLEKNPEFKIHAGDNQLRHAESLGMGSREYELINY